MSTIADLLTRYVRALTDIRTALAGKGQSVPDHGFEDIPDDIAAISAADLVSGTLTISSAGTHDVTDYASASVAAGSAGTPTATKGTVSNHSVSVTPKVINSAGYISGGTKTGSAVTVSASELVSGSLAVTENGDNIDVTNYAAVNVNVAGSGGSVIPSDIPSDGKTRICYRIPSDAQTHGRKITLCYYHTSSSSKTTVDWGDGSTNNYTGSGRKTNTHTYSAAGTYIVTITVTAGTIYFGGGNSYTVYGSYNSASTIYQRNYIQWVVLGNSVTKCDTYSFYLCYSLQEIRFPSSGFTAIGNYAFYMCMSLRGPLTIPNTVTTLGTYAFSYCVSLEGITLPTNSTLKTINDYCFRYCFALKSITIPSQFTTFKQYAFGSCYSLREITLPSNMTSVPTYLFQQAYGLSYLSIPSNVTTIEANAFNNCAGLQKLRFNRATPPTVSSSDAFTGIPTSCIISVPTGSLTAYKNATNYPSSSSYTYVEEAA